MGYAFTGSTPIGLHYSGPRTPPVLAAFGLFGGVAVSFDSGLTWQAAAAPVVNHRGAAFSPPLGYAIAVATTGAVSRAVDPLIWAAFPGTLGAGPARPIWTNVNGGRFVVARSVLGFGIETSPDGSAWTPRATPVAGGATSWNRLLELPSGRIIATGLPNNVPFIFSDDGGDTWAYCAALPLARVDGCLEPVLLPTGSAYFPSTFATGAPFSDYRSDNGGLSFVQLQVFPGAGGGATCCAVSPSGVVLRGDGTGLFRTTVGNLGGPPPPPPDIYGPSLPGVNVQDLLFSGGGFVGVQVNGAVLQVRRSPLGLVATWSDLVTALAGDFRNISSLAF